MGRSDTIYLLDDDAEVRDALGLFLESEGYNVAQITTARDLLDAVNDESHAIVVLDHYLTGMSGLELQAELNARHVDWPVIFISGGGDIRLSVKAMKAGAVDFLEKPVKNEDLLVSVETAFEKVNELERARRLKALAQQRSSSLSEREREVMEFVVAGMSNSSIAEHLGLSIRTVEVHRANIKKKMAADSLVELVRMADLCCNGTAR